MKRNFSVAILLTAVLTIAGSLQAQDPGMGKWKLNLAKSKYSPGPAPKSMTRTVEAQGDKVKYTFEGVNADGSAVSYSFAVAYDGKDYPINGVAPSGADSISFTKPASGPVEAHMKKGSETVLVSRVKVSGDGKTVTIEQTGKGGVKNTVVYEKL